jgi:hypothetical protein
LTIIVISKLYSKKLFGFGLNTIDDPLNGYEPEESENDLNNPFIESDNARIPPVIV